MCRDILCHPFETLSFLLFFESQLTEFDSRLHICARLLERRRARPDEYFLRLGSPICLYYRAITRAAELVFPFFANR